MITGKAPIGAVRSHLTRELEEHGPGTKMIETNHPQLCGCPCLGPLAGEMEMEIARPLMSDQMNRQSGDGSLLLSFPGLMEQEIGRLS